MTPTLPGFHALLLHGFATALIVGGQGNLPGGLAASAWAAPPSSAAAATTEAPATSPSPFMGAWELDLARMPDTYGKPPKRVVYVFSDMGDGRWQTTIDITAPDDGVRHIAIQYRRDGSMAQSEGDKAEGDSAAFNSPAPNVLVMSTAKNKQLQSVRAYAISTDGQQMTESAADVDNDGVPFVRNFYYRRLR